MGRPIYLLRIAPGLTIVGSPPDATVDTAYSYTLNGDGGTPPYSWAISGGSLPPGLSLNTSTGEISGTPTTAGDYNFTIQLSDSAGASTSVDYSMSVAEIVLNYTDYLFVTSWEGAAGNGSFSAYDLADPDSPSLLHRLEDADLDDARDFVMDGNYAYVASRNAGTLTIIDCSDVNSLSKVGSLSTADLAGARHVAKVGDYCYVCCDGSGKLVAVDVSNPSSPSQVDSLTTTELANPFGIDVDQAGGHVHVVNSSTGYLCVVDISTPSAMSQVATFTHANFNNPHQIWVEGDYAYVCCTGLGSYTFVIDVSTPTSPTLSDHSQFGTDRPNWPVKDGNYVYAAEQVGSANGLWSIDVSDPAAIASADTLAHADLNNCKGLTILGTRLYAAAAGADKLTVVDISTPTVMAFVGSQAVTDPFDCLVHAIGTAS